MKFRSVSAKYKSMDFKLASHRRSGDGNSGNQKLDSRSHDSCYIAGVLCHIDNMILSLLHVYFMIHTLYTITYRYIICNIYIFYVTPLSYRIALKTKILYCKFSVKEIVKDLRFHIFQVIFNTSPVYDILNS